MGQLKLTSLAAWWLVASPFLLITNSSSISLRESTVVTHHEWTLKSLIHQFLLCDFIHVMSVRNDNSPYSNPDAFKYQNAGHLIMNISTEVDFHQLLIISKLNKRRCSLVLIYVDLKWNASEMSTRLFDTLIPRNGSLIRKDEDYFTFVCSKATEKICDQFSMSETFGNKIRNKISLIGDENEVTVKTINLYGTTGESILGKVFIRDPLVNSPFPKLAQLFPDHMKSFNGKVFKISYPKAPFYIEVEQINGVNYPKRGLYSIWLVEMSQKMNFSFSLTLLGTFSPL